MYAIKLNFSCHVGFTFWIYSTCTAFMVMRYEGCSHVGLMHLMNYPLKDLLLLYWRSGGLARKIWFLIIGSIG
jgi:hypothetical protein